MEVALKEFLEKNKLKYKEYTHPAVFTCEEAEKYCTDIPGIQCKNLFLKDKKSEEFFLVTLPATKKCNLNELGEKIGGKKFTFANEQKLKEILHLSPGSVSPLGLIHDTKKQVTFIIDKEVWNAELVNFHPNINTASLLFAQVEFHRLVHLLTKKTILL